MMLMVFWADLIFFTAREVKKYILIHVNSKQFNLAGAHAHGGRICQICLKDWDHSFEALSTILRCFTFFLKGSLGHCMFLNRDWRRNVK